MAKVRMAMLLIAIGLSSSFLGFGLDWSLSDGDDQGYGWYISEAPKDIGHLTDEGLQSVQDERNSLLIVDSNGTGSRTSLKVPVGVFVRLKLLPVSSGELNLYCRFPTGSTDLLLAGRVEKGHCYRAWYQTGFEGDYEIWYTVDKSNSNSVLFNTSNPVVAEFSRGFGTSGGLTATAPAMAYKMLAPAAPAALAAPSIGFSTGGAKDINNFRENIKQNYLPLPTDITYEGLFYDYYFDTGQAKECNKLFCPSYSYAISRDPFSKEPQYYLSVGLNSGITDFKRKKLNLVVVLDYSGSMGSTFDSYYYDRSGNQINLDDSEDSGKTKMEIADKAVVSLLDHLNPDDRFGMVIFSDDAFVVDPMTPVGDKNLGMLKAQILKIREAGSTNMEAGMKLGNKLIARYLDADPSEYENRIIFLTDAMPNIGDTGEEDLSQILEDNAAHRIYTTFIGIGLDFNTELVDRITKIRGANYYSVHSAKEFKQRMDDEFDFMVTPLVFDLRLNLNAPGYRIEKVYGSPEADEATGELMKVNTLFPSRTEEGAVKGGVVLVKLKKLSQESNPSQDSSMRLKVSYADRNGVPDSDEAVVDLQGMAPDYYQNNGIRKAILLSRYADLFKDWTMDERKAVDTGRAVVPAVTFETGIVVPVILGEWERQSQPLHVSEPYHKLFSVFSSYFGGEKAAIGDDTLQQEQDILDKLKTYEGAGQIQNSAHST
ncbi:MAG: VWA domain-containing protein [Methanotrichaceae archaeon]